MKRASDDSPQKFSKDAEEPPAKKPKEEAQSEVEEEKKEDVEEKQQEEEMETPDVSEETAVEEKSAAEKVPEVSAERSSEDVSRFWRSLMTDNGVIIDYLKYSWIKQILLSGETGGAGGADGDIDQSERGDRGSSSCWEQTQRGVYAASTVRPQHAHWWGHFLITRQLDGLC